MNCEKARELLERVIAGDLSGEEARSVRWHFASCSTCAAGLSASQWMDILPVMDKTIEPSGDFAIRFHSKLQARPQRWWKKVLVWGWPRQLVAAGALASMILAGVLVLRHPVGRPDRFGDTGDIGVAQNLPLLQDMPVINNLDLLEDFDAIENLPHLMKESSVNSR
jgi:hypothetical protein